MNHIKKLQTKLDEVSDEKTRKWFENYLKNAISYRGVKTPTVAKIVSHWRVDKAIDKLPLKKQMEIACDLIREKKAEDKFAGIIYIQKYLLGSLETDILLQNFSRLYDQEAFQDWSTTDWFCIRVLDPFIMKSEDTVAREIGSWYKSRDLWQRRSSIVSFRGSAKKNKYLAIIKRNIASLVKEDERFIQTAIGWLISELSRHYPDEANNIVSEHFSDLSYEVVNRHTKYLPDHKKLKERKRKSLR
ncbi:MAG: DNA alkylation repair protein [Candidatus Dadabacteria bacterium]|nr:DNA alkylation repair protein [Candidatus Dadabacteria bacterium]MYC40282.1 DNA alkylation repair protein [Candidatus Dadabacteria bacterium]